MNKKELGRLKRHGRVRKKLSGTADRPRLAVHRSLKNLYAQVIDDVSSSTVLSFSTLEKEFVKAYSKQTKTEAATKLGEFYGKRLLEKGIQKIAFDRGGYLFHGRVKALAESLRKAGVNF